MIQNKKCERIRSVTQNGSTSLRKKKKCTEYVINQIIIKCPSAEKLKDKVFFLNSWIKIFGSSKKNDENYDDIKKEISLSEKLNLI